MKIPKGRDYVNMKGRLAVIDAEEIGLRVATLLSSVRPTPKVLPECGRWWCVAISAGCQTLCQTLLTTLLDVGWMPRTGAYMRMRRLAAAFAVAVVGAVSAAMVTATTVATDTAQRVGGAARGASPG